MWEIKKMLVTILAMALLLVILTPEALAATYQDGIYRDKAPGYNDEVIVTVTVRDGKITELSAQNKSGEHSEYFKKAEEGLASAIVEKQGIDGVDAVSGATGTSESILTAMEGILQQAQYAGAAADAGQGAAGGASGGTPGADGDMSSTEGGASTDGAQSTADGNTRAPATPRPTLDPAQAEAFTGLGSVANFRVGPGKDEEGTPVYSFNVTMANAIFDKDGKIIDVQVDIYEISTPNYDGESMPHFSGWPGYSVYDSAAGKLSGVSENTEESAQAELESWKTKRERGDAYGMNPQNEWYKQMNNYEQWMIGKTVSEVRSWFARYTSERNGRPIKQDSDDADDKKVYAALSDDEKAQLYDVVSMATMSLSDSHGLILEAIEKAYDQRTPLDGVGIR